MIQQLGYYLTHPGAILYAVASVLLYPVLIGQVSAFAVVLFDAGRFTAEAWRRRKRSLPALETAAGTARVALRANRPADAVSALGALEQGLFVGRFFKGIGPDMFGPITLVKHLSEVESQVTRRLDLTRVLTRLGPMLGLMGTLIPISPALVGLAQGDVETLSKNLIIAFSATVVGLLVGGTAFVIGTVRERMYAQDLSDIEYTLDLLDLPTAAPAAVATAADTPPIAVVGPAATTTALDGVVAPAGVEPALEQGGAS
jgi:biopolymer transport protein ExbB/TolQ